MSINCIRVDELVDLSNNAGLVVIPTYDSTPTLPQLIELLDKTLPNDFGILIVDDNSPNFNTLMKEISAVATNSNKVINIFKQDSNLGFVKNVNTVFKNISGLDIILCNSDVLPAINWFPGLFAAAKSSSLVATATAVTNFGSIATVEFPKISSDYLATLNLLGQSSEVEEKSFPTLPTCVGHFVYFNAVALETVGSFDEIFSPGYGEEVDWSQRAISLGFRHVLAPESVVIHDGSLSFSKKLGSDLIELKDKNNQLLHDRYSNLSHMVEAIWAKDRSQVESSRLNFKAISSNLSLRIDLTFLRPRDLETSLAKISLALSSRILLLQHFKKIEFVVSDDMNIDSILPHLSLDARVIHWKQANDLPRTDFVFRPSQIHTKLDLVRLHDMGKRQVICQFDFTDYENPYGFENFQKWVIYRSTTELAYELVDGIIYFSEFAKRQSSLLGMVADNDYVVDIVALARTNPDGQILECLGLNETDNEPLFATTEKLDQVSKNSFGNYDAEIWDAVVKKIVAHIDKLTRVNPTTTKDAIWNLLLKNYVNVIRDDDERIHLLELDKQANSAIELHNLRLNKSVLYRFRHSKAGVFLVPKDSYRDRVVQRLIPPPSNLPKKFG